MQLSDCTSKLKWIAASLSQNTARHSQWGKSHLSFIMGSLQLNKKFCRQCAHEVFEIFLPKEEGFGYPEKAEDNIKGNHHS